MRKVFSIAAVLIFSAHSMAQVSWLQDGRMPYNDSTKFFLQIQGERSDYSNALSREFVQTALFGGYIDNELKSNANSHLNGTNNYAGLLNTSVYFTLFPDSSKFGFSVGYEFVNMASIQFSDDLYNLAMYGNSMFGEETIDLGNSKENYIQYQKFAFGLVQKSSGAFISLGLYDGMDYINYDLGNMKMSTQYKTQNGVDYAESVVINTNNFSSSQNNKADNVFESGYGFGLSGGYQLKTKVGNFNVSVRDLGMMRWNELSSRDTSGNFNYDGLYWDFGSDSQDSDIFKSLKDSIVPNEQIEDKWVVLPGNVELSYFTSTDRKLSAAITASYRWGINLNPELQATGIYHIKNDNMVWVNGSVGGFYGASVGLGASFTFLKSSSLSIGSKYITGWVSQNGRATNVFLQYNLRL